MEVYEAINAIMKECGVVGKDSTNTQQNFKFRGIDAILNTVSPLMQKHGLIIVPETIAQVPVEHLLTKQGGNLSVVRIAVNYMIYAKDGSSIRASVAAEAMDSGDKATAKAMSVAFRTLLIQLFALATGEPDADSHTYETQPSVKWVGTTPTDDEPPFDPWATNERPMPSEPPSKKECKHGARKYWQSSKTGKELWFCPLDKNDPDVCAAVSE